MYLAYKTTGLLKSTQISPPLISFSLIQLHFGQYLSLPLFQLSLAIITASFLVSDADYGMKQNFYQIIQLSSEGILELLN